MARLQAAWLRYWPGGLPAVAASRRGWSGRPGPRRDATTPPQVLGPSMIVRYGGPDVAPGRVRHRPQQGGTVDDQPATAPAAMSTGELLDALSQATARTKALLDAYDGAADQLLTAAAPAEPGGVRAHYEELRAVVNAASARRDHTLGMLTQLTDIIADLAEAAYRADEQAAWAVYRRAVAPADLAKADPR